MLELNPNKITCRKEDLPDGTKMWCGYAPYKHPYKAPNSYVPIAFHTDFKGAIKQVDTFLRDVRNTRFINEMLKRGCSGR